MYWHTFFFRKKEHNFLNCLSQLSDFFHIIIISLKKNNNNIYYLFFDIIRLITRPWKVNLLRRV